MRRAVFGISVVALVAALGAGVAASTAKPPAKNAVSISVTPMAVVYGSSAHVSGQVVGNKAPGATVELWGKPATTMTFSKVASTTATATGQYSFTVAPRLNTTYHVVAKTAPPVTSADQLAGVQVKVTLGVRVVGTKHRFFGNVTPAYNGKFAVLQHKTPSGWARVTSVPLVPGTPAVTIFGSTPRSHYSKKVNVLVGDMYRIHFNPADGRLLPNNSNVRVAR